MLKTALKRAAAFPFQRNVYLVRDGLARGLKRRGGLGFLASTKPFTVEESFLAQVPLAGCTVYDIGCLEGMYTLFFARAVGSKGRVVAFEPNPANCTAVRDNVELNGFQNVRVHEFGLGAVSSQAELVIPYGFPGQGTAREDLQKHYLQSAGTARVAIRIEPLDQAAGSLALPPPDLMKIDVEGFELQVLQGALETLRNFRPRLFIELHGLEETERTGNVRRIIELLAGLGYAPPIHVETARTVDASAVPYEGHLWYA